MAASFGVDFKVFNVEQVLSDQPPRGMAVSLRRFLCALWIVCAAVDGSPGQAATLGEPPAVEYLIGVGDVLQSSVWKSPELSVTVPVRPDGKITLPLVGEIAVIGKEPQVVQQAVGEAYARFITAPTVSLVVTQINSRKIYIVGEVKASGVYDLFQPTTLMKALAMAGGVTEWAKKDEIVVLRQTEAGNTRLVVSMKDITSGKSLDDNVLLFPGDTIVVP